MRNKALVGIIGLAVFVTVVAVGLLVVKGAPTPTAAPASSTIGPSGSTTSTTVATIPPETSAAPTSSVTIIPVRVECNGQYSPREVLPLSPCDEGFGVMILQESLIGYGYAIDADGYYGPATATAVQDFQFRNGLAATGTCDAATWLAIAGERPGYDLDGDGVVGPNEIVYD